jgi:diadenosine tetraphosphate (Ap4A) HIT family hydrolase
MELFGYDENFLLTKTFGELVDMGICPTCFDKATGGKFFGDQSKLKLFKDEDIECLFVDNPRAVGHMMIKPIEHYHDMSEAPDEINEKIIRFAREFMIILKEVFGCERVYLCTMSDGKMNHYHVQLIPRYANEERGSKNFVKPRMKYVYDEQKTTMVRQKISNYARKS